jgi:transglutaminase-like putative cysteine protease
MKRLFLGFILILVLLHTAIAQEPTNLYRYDALTIDLTISGALELHREREEAYIKDISAELTLFPRVTVNQDILSLTTDPDATETDDAMIFSWKYPEEDTLEFSLTSRIETEATPTTVRNKVQFPFIVKDNDIKEYLEETEMIDYANSNIKTVATELATGEDDAFVVAVKMAEWTRKTISYNLTSLTAEATQSASWVLENQYGVCDELTNLYIALLRNVGIPARFVTGISYTTSSLFSDPWNPHGWAEVYFPDYGWIPFDVTYGQYSFSDPTHIKLADAVDSQQSSISYRWEGKDVGVSATSIKFETEIIAYGDLTEEPVKIEATAYKEEVGFGSYNLITTVIENNVGYYVPLHVYLAVPSEITILGETEMTIVLEPNEEVTQYWLIKVSDNLDPQYEYTFAPKLYTLANQSTEARFKANAKGIIIDENTLQEISNKKAEEKAKTYAKEITLTCDIDEEQFYPETPGIVTCRTTNTGNTAQAFDLCFETSCKEVSLGITETQETTFIIETTEPGSHLSVIEGTNNDITKITEIEYTILDEPSLTIATSIDETTTYGTSIPLTILADKASTQTPQKVLFSIKYGNKEQWYQVDEIEEQTEVEHIIDTIDFREEVSTIIIHTIYEDVFGNQFEQEKTTTVTITDLTLWQKTKIWILKVLGF